MSCYLSIIYEFLDGLINLLTNPDVLYGGIVEDENKIKRFLLDIRYDLGKGDKRSSRYRTIIVYKRIERKSMAGV